METNLKIKSAKYLKKAMVISFLLFSLNAAAPNEKVVFILVSDPVDPYEKLVNAVMKVESSGDTLAFNPVEQAIGAFQIRPIRLRDYNERTGNNYKLTDCYNLKIAKEIFLYYAKKIGYPDYESIARSWNGSGKATRNYWMKVKSNL
jgi:hypothetical protein